MHIQYLLSIILAASAVRAAVNEPCVGADKTAGVCVSSSSCKDSGGETIDGACPDSADVKCCTKPSCSDNSKGNCRWTSDCDGGKEESGLCPGPAAVKCCMSDKEGFGGYDPPDIPSGNGCEKVTTTGAQKIVDQFPGRVREVFCTRDCECNPPDSSDHCCGKASDMMCSDEGSTPTMSGQEIAEWVMRNRDELNLKYVIWGQHIWVPSRDKEASWPEWRAMEDRGSVTENHWDHVHVSYN